MRRYFIILGATFALSACAPFFGSNGEPLAQITFDQVNAKSLYVASYEVARLPTSKVDTPLPNGFLLDPEQLVYDYLSNRYGAVGNQGKLTANITDVSVDYEVLESENVIGAMVGVGKKDFYRVAVAIDVEAYGTREFAEQRQSITVFRDISISEHISLVNREQAQVQAMDNMLDDLDVALRKLFKEQFQILK